MKQFLQKNSVVLASFISALVLVLQQAISSQQTDWKAIGFAAFISLVGVVARNFKGKGWTLAGILGTLAGVFHDIWSTGTFTWNEFILSALVAFLLALLGHIAPAPAPETEQSKS